MAGIKGVKPGAPKEPMKFPKRLPMKEKIPGPSQDAQFPKCMDHSAHPLPAPLFYSLEAFPQCSLCSWGPQPRGWVFPLRHRIFPPAPALTFSYIWLKSCFFDSPHVFNKYIHIIAILSFGSGIFLAVFI